MHSVLQIPVFAQQFCDPAHSLSAILPAPTLANLRAPFTGPFASFLFETQAVYWLALVVVAAALFFTARTRANPRLLKISGALALLLVLWIASAYLIDTPRERLRAANEGLARAASSHDIPAIVRYMRPDFQAPKIGVSRRDLADTEIQDRLKSYGIKGNTITGFGSDILPSGTQAIARVAVLTETESIGNILTKWELEWVDVPGEDWRIQHADLVKIGDQDVPIDHVVPR